MVTAVQCPPLAVRPCIARRLFLPLHRLRISPPGGASYCQSGILVVTAVWLPVQCSTLAVSLHRFLAMLIALIKMAKDITRPVELDECLRQYSDPVRYPSTARHDESNRDTER
jgi:hypothetical protein